MSKDFEYDPETGSFRFDESGGKTKKKNEDKSNGLHVCTPLFCLRCIQHITLFPPRQGGGPILPGRLERGSEDFRPLRGGGFPAIIQISYGYGRFQIFLFRMQ